MEYPTNPKRNGFSKNIGHNTAHFSLQAEQGNIHKLPLPISLLTQIDVKLPAVGETLSLCKWSHFETIVVVEIVLSFYSSLKWRWDGMEHQDLLSNEAKWDAFELGHGLKWMENSISTSFFISFERLWAAGQSKTTPMLKMSQVGYKIHEEIIFNFHGMAIAYITNVKGENV